MFSSKNLFSSLKGLKSILNQRYLIIVVFFSAALLNSHCASMQQPTGGPKDTIPPKILNESPSNLTRNFSDNEIVIEFDEFIKLQNEFKEISVTPEMDRLPIFKVRRRNLVIALPDSLEEKTTYTINFGKAIGDFNEGNALLNYSYVLATGDEIDSLNVSGRVINALTREKMEETTVMLIPVSQDSIFGKRKANIFTQTDTSGNFRMQNLKEGAYRIYALNEQNNDRIYNSPDEEIGFLDDSIYLSKDTSGIVLIASRAIPETFRLLDRKIEKNGTINFLFNKRLEDPDIDIVHPAELNETKIIQYNANRDSANMWVEKLDFDSLKVKFYDADKLLDSVTIRRGRNEKYDRDLIITDNLNGQKVNRIEHLRLFSTAPISNVNKGQIVLLEDSVQRNFQLIPDTANLRRYTLRYNWRPKRNYELQLKENAFSGLFGEESKEVSRKFTLDDTENFGDMILQVNVPDTLGKQYLVQIVNIKKDHIYRSIPITTSQNIVLRQFPGGKYLIRIVYDENRNSRWDPGDVYNKIQPEYIWYFDKVLSIRANWEQEETINIPQATAK